MRRKAVDQDIRICQQSGLTASEAARLLHVSEGCIRQRAKRLQVEFVRRRGTPSRARDEIADRTQRRPCAECADRKLCILCHRLRVEAIPCEDNLVGAAEERLPVRWPTRYMLLANHQVS